AQARRLVREVDRDPGGELRVEIPTIHRATTRSRPNPPKYTGYVGGTPALSRARAPWPRGGPGWSQRRRLQPDEGGRPDMGQGADLAEDGVGNGAVEAQDRDGPPARDLPTELHAGDVDAVGAEEGPDAPDDARHVVVGCDAQPPFQAGLLPEPVDL